VRERVVSVRLTEAEHARWAGALAGSPWRSLAHWCREVLLDFLSRPPIASPAGVADVSAAEVEVFARACAGLNGRVKDGNRLGRVVAGSLAAGEEVAGLAGKLLPTLVVSDSADAADAAEEPIPVIGWGRQTELVNVRLSASEFAAFEDAAHRAGFTRVSSWARHSIAGLLGYRLAARRHMIPAGVAEVRRQLAGAVTNLAQLVDLAEGYDTALADRFETVHTEVVALLREFHELGRVV
jgi:hypothetical protein